MRVCVSVCNYILSLQLIKLAKRLKKEKVAVDIVNFGETVSGVLSPILCVP